MTYIFGALVFFCGSFIGLVAGLMVGASRRDGPATWNEPMDWQSDAYGGEK